MVRHRHRDHRYHEPVTQRSRLGFRRQARRKPLPSRTTRRWLTPREGAPVWSVVSAPVPSALSGQGPRGSASRGRSRGMVCNRQHRQRASCEQHPTRPEGNREVNIVKKAQAIAAEAHAGVFRSCGEPYINHPTRVVARLAALDIGLRAAGAVLAAGCAVVLAAEMVHWRASRLAAVVNPTRGSQRGDFHGAAVTVIVLGYPTPRSGRPHPVQRWRTEIAVRTLAGSPNGLAAFTGGNRTGHGVEAQTMADYARDWLGWPQAQILTEIRAGTTRGERLVHLADAGVGGVDRLRLRSAARGQGAASPDSTAALSRCQAGRRRRLPVRRAPAHQARRGRV